MKPVWRCKCDYEEDDSPDIKRPLAAHLLNGRRVDGSDMHDLLGLYDADTGDLIFQTRSRKEALQRGFVSNGDQPEPKDGKPSAPAPKKPSSPKKSGSYMRGQVLYRNIPLPASIEGYFALYRTTFNDDWSNDDDGIAQFIIDLIEGFTQEHLPQIFGFEPDDQSAIARVEKTLETIRRMADPEAEPEPEKDADDKKLLLMIMQRLESLERRLPAVG